MKTGAKSDEERPKDTLVSYPAPKEEPALTMGGNYYYRLHLIMMDIDRSALNNSLQEWYDSLYQLYVNVKPMIKQKENHIDKKFNEIENHLFDPRINCPNPTEKAYHKGRSNLKVRKLLRELNSYLLYKMNEAKMLFPTIKKKGLDYFSRSIVGNKKNYTKQVEKEYPDEQHNV